jgi:hypothetical protein
MKILLFNLGTIEHRVLSWEADGFKSLFDQDIILWGPVPDPHFIYNGKEIPILRVFEETTVEGLFRQLPAGWYPDIVSCDTSAINYVPDIYLCPVKTLIFTRDSWSDTVFNRGLVEFFDFMNSSTADRNAYSQYRVNMLPLRGFAVSTPGPGAVNSELEKRDIDVVAIANYDNSFYHERHRVFYRLAEVLGSRYDIRFLRSIKRSEIYNYYQRSKIVLDWAHTLSNRSYEAALNGCLLFSHEDNTVMRQFWIPWEEYIPYNETNLPELISRYLENPELSAQVSSRAQRKMIGMPATWGEMAWDRICAAHESEVDIRSRIEYNVSLEPHILHHRTATPLLYNYDYGKDFPQDWRELFFERIDRAISSTDRPEEKIPPLVEASRLAFLIGKEALALTYLDQLELHLPYYGWTYYLKARIAFTEGKYDDASDLLQHGIHCGGKAPELLKRYVLPVIEKGNSCDGRRITDYMWESVHNNDSGYQAKSFMHLSFELDGYIHARKNEVSGAVDSYLSAIEYLAIPDCIYRLAPLLIETGNYMKLAEIASEGHKDSPYDTVVLLYEVYGLLWTGRRKEAAGKLRRHRQALCGFKGIRQIYLIRMIFLGLLPLIFLSKRLSSLLVRKLIQTIRSKSGKTYLGLI